MTATTGTRTNGQAQTELPRRRARGRPRLEDVADIEIDLVEVALSEFLKHGYGGTSMATIVKAAGVSKTTLYSRFASKEDLFIAMMKKMVEGDLSARIRAVESPSRPLADMLREFAYQSLEIGLDPVHYGVVRLIYGESHRFPELRQAGEALAQASRSGILNIITGFAEREGLRFADPEQPANFLALTLRGVHLDIVLSDTKELDAHNREEIGRMIDLLVASMDRW
jgi:TetR/AcrR family transcriptional regulator, mexJK operon transcriptional repressor